MIAHKITGMNCVHVTIHSPIERHARRQFCMVEVPVVPESFDPSETEEDTCCCDVEIAIHAIATRKTLEIIVQENVSNVSNEFSY